MPNAININISHPQLINQRGTSLIFLLEIHNLSHQFLLPPLKYFLLDIDFLRMFSLHFFYGLQEIRAEQVVFMSEGAWGCAFFVEGARDLLQLLGT